MINEARLRRLENAVGGSDRGARTPMAIPEMPNIITFVLDFLGLELYPRQASLLKAIFLQTELFTAYDRQLFEEEWFPGFGVIEDLNGVLRYDGHRGTPGDLYERIERCRADGRTAFREVVVVGGRRGSKGFIGAICGAYQTWRFLCLGDPRTHYAIAPDKRLDLLVFAGKHEQAKVNQWQDLADIITHSSCFDPYRAEVSNDTIRLYSPSQLTGGRKPPPADAAIRISAQPSTPLAGRGQATFAQLFDEMAHIEANGANRSAEEIYGASSPALADVEPDAFLYEASSPWQMLGQFYANYAHGLEVDRATMQAVSYDTLVVQFPSEELYKDWERTGPDGLEAYPGGPTFPRKRRAIYSYNDRARREQRRDPENYRVEFDAQWATSVAAYLSPNDVDALFGPWQGQTLAMVEHGVLSESYICHVDPSLVGANTALAIGHRVGPDHDGDYHSVFDWIKVWRPQDFADGRISYQAIERELEALMHAFPLEEITFDQFNSAGTIERLQDYARSASGLTRRPRVYAEVATAPRNKKLAETFKHCLTRGLVHAPFHELADQELRFLERRGEKIDHPHSGPCQTSDVADCLFEIVYRQLGEGSGVNVMRALSELPVGMSLRGGIGQASNPYAGKFSAAGRVAGNMQSAPRGSRYVPGRGRWQARGRQR